MSGLLARLASLAALALACSSNDIAYTPDADERFAVSLLGAYTAAGLSLVVCEDTAPDALACRDGSTTDCGGSCHVIRGGGRASAESLPAAGRGCDCSTPSAELSVHADLVLGDGSHLALRGTIATAPAEGDPYGAPLALRVSSGDAHLATSLRGEIKDGTMRLRLSSPPADAGAGAWPADPSAPLTFGRTGDCP